MKQIPTIVKAKTPIAAFHYTLADAEPEPQLDIGVRPTMVIGMVTPPQPPAKEPLNEWRWLKRNWPWAHRLIFGSPTYIGK